MVGTFADVVVADAIVKNVPNFDLKLAKDALLKDVSHFVCCCTLCVHSFMPIADSFLHYPLAD